MTVSVVILDCFLLVLGFSIGALHLRRQVPVLHLVVFRSLSREEFLPFSPATACTWQSLGPSL